MNKYERGICVKKMIFVVMAAVHIGRRIKEVLERSSLSVTDFADSINKSRTVVYDIFGRPTIDTGLLMKISRVLEHDFFGYYNHDSAWISKEDRAGYIRKHEVLAQMQEELQSLRKHVAELEKRCELLEKVNRLQEEKLNRKKNPG